MRELVFLLEEESARVMIEGILPKLLKPGIAPRYIVFEGKQDLEKSMLRKLRSYNNPDATFIILRDQDSADCRVVKDKLKQKCTEANKPNAIVRVVCREL